MRKLRNIQTATKTDNRVINQSVKQKELDRFIRSRQWKKLRDRYIADNPLCEICKEHLAEEVDHIIDRSIRPDLSLEWDKLQALCKSCHSKKTRKSFLDKAL